MANNNLVPRVLSYPPYGGGGLERTLGTRLGKETSALSAKQRSARLKFVKRYKSVTVNRGRADYLLLDECLKYIFQLPKRLN